MHTYTYTLPSPDNTFMYCTRTEPEFNHSLTFLCMGTECLSRDERYDHVNKVEKLLKNKA